MSDLRRATSARLGDLVRGMRVTAGSERVALCIGISNYPSSPLRNAVNDARDVGAALSDIGFKVNTVLDASLDAMLDAVEAFSTSLRPGGVAFFYFAGHGCQARPSAAAAARQSRRWRRGARAPVWAQRKRGQLGATRSAGCVSRYRAALPAQVVAAPLMRRTARAPCAAYHGRRAAGPRAAPSVSWQ